MCLATRIWVAALLFVCALTPAAQGQFVAKSGSEGARIKIVDSDGRAIPNAEIQIIDSHGVPLLSSTTNEKGEFYVTLAAAKPGQYVVRVTLRGFGISESPFVVETHRVFGITGPSDETTVNGHNVREGVTITVPIGSPPPPPERKKLDALYWNAWIEEHPDDGALRLETVTTLRTRQDYVLALDLSALSYQAQNGLYSSQLAGSLMKLIADPKTTHLDINVYLLYDQRYFAPLSAKEAYQTTSVSISKIRAVEADKNLVIPEHVSLKDAFRPELSGLRFIDPLRFPLKTNRKEGSTSLGLSVWYRGVPVQEILLPPVCISDSQPEKCDVESVPTASFSGLDSAALIGVERAGQPTPAFALHLIDLQEQGTKAVFKCNTCPGESAFFTWTITSSLADLGQQLRESILLNVDAVSQVADPTWLRTAGKSILRLLFNGDNPTDSKSAIKMLSDSVKNSDLKNPPVLFVRAIAAGQDPLFLLPIGMAAVDTSNQGVEYLGFHLRIETPLLNANYKTAACVDKWRLLVPPEGIADRALKKGREALQAGLQRLGNLRECTGEPADSNCEFSDMGKFSDWISTDDPVQPNEALVLLGHHDNNRIYWSAKDAVPAALFVAKFRQPSIVIFNACGTAKPGETALLKNLNQNGDVSTIIATYSEVPGAMAGTFTSILIDKLSSHKSVDRYSLAQAVFDTTLKLRDEPVPADYGAPKDTKYGAFALLFGLVGNGGVSVCVP